MIEAYSKVPRPHGTVVAADIFSSGIIMSEYVLSLIVIGNVAEPSLSLVSTDFVQFEKYLGISGLDVGQSYCRKGRTLTSLVAAGYCRP